MSEPITDDALLQYLSHLKRTTSVSLKHYIGTGHMAFITYYTPDSLFPEQEPWLISFHTTGGDFLSSKVGTAEEVYQELRLRMEEWGTGELPKGIHYVQPYQKEAR